MDSILRLISGNETLNIEALNDGNCIKDAKPNPQYVFLSNNFFIFNLNKPSHATAEMLVEVHEIIGDGTFVEVFSSLSHSLDKLVMTQSQIVYFCRKYSYWLNKEGHHTYFLTKKGDKYFVITVNANEKYFNINEVDAPESGMHIYVDPLVEYNDICYGDVGHRVVSPKLTPI